jgi:spermidine synthase
MMNTSYHWREMASALLSREFLELVRAHLKPGGFVMWNCTQSSRAIRTGMEVFPHTMMVYNNCVGSLEPLTIDKKRWRAVLVDYHIDGRPVFDLHKTQDRLELNAVMTFLDNPGGTNKNWCLTTHAAMQRLYGQAPLITDDNLGEEYRSSLQTFLTSLVPGLNKVFALFN